MHLKWRWWREQKTNPPPQRQGRSTSTTSTSAPARTPSPPASSVYNRSVSGSPSREVREEREAAQARRSVIRGESQRRRTESPPVPTRQIAAPAFNPYAPHIWESSKWPRPARWRAGIMPDVPDDCTEVINSRLSGRRTDAVKRIREPTALLNDFYAYCVLVSQLHTSMDRPNVMKREYNELRHCIRLQMHCDVVNRTVWVYLDDLAQLAGHCAHNREMCRSRCTVSASVNELLNLLGKRVRSPAPSFRRRADSAHLPMTTTPCMDS